MEFKETDYASSNIKNGLQVPGVQAMQDSASDESLIRIASAINLKHSDAKTHQLDLKQGKNRIQLSCEASSDGLIIIKIKNNLKHDLLSELSFNTMSGIAQRRSHVTIVWPKPSMIDKSLLQISKESQGVYIARMTNYRFNYCVSVSFKIA